MTENKRVTQLHDTGTIQDRWKRVYENSNPWQTNPWSRMWEFAKRNNINIPRHANVLDIGGGSGEKAQAFIESYNPSSLTLLDIASNAVSTANIAFVEKYPGKLYSAYQANLNNQSEIAQILTRTYDVMMDSLALQFLETTALTNILATLHHCSIPGKTLFLHQSMTPRFGTPTQEVRAVTSLTDDQYQLINASGFIPIAEERFYMRNGGQESRMAIFRATE